MKRNKKCLNLIQNLEITQERVRNLRKTHKIANKKRISTS